MTSQLEEILRELKGHNKNKEVGNSSCTYTNQREERSIGQTGGATLPRYSKLEFPSYDSTDDPLI